MAFETYHPLRFAVCGEAIPVASTSLCTAEFMHIMFILCWGQCFDILPQQCYYGLLMDEGRERRSEVGGDVVPLKIKKTCP